MFDKEYSFKGSHAEKVNKLTAKFDDKNQLFKRNLDVYMMAPVVGFLYQRKADANTGDGNQKPTKIFPQQLIENSDDLVFAYRLIMLLDKKMPLRLMKELIKHLDSLIVHKRKKMKNYLTNMY